VLIADGETDRQAFRPRKKLRDSSFGYKLRGCGIDRKILLVRENPWTGAPRGDAVMVMVCVVRGRAHIVYAVAEEHLSPQQ